MMAVKIHQYMTKHLELSDEEASRLQQEYWYAYGDALEGLMRHYNIGIPHETLVLMAEPLEYNREVDEKLDWTAVLKPSPALAELLSSIDMTKVKLWILTNAYITHAKRVLKLLGIERFFEGNNAAQFWTLLT
jgi:pyrimidine 5'-nucleotidase